jgi:hypothetical protein
MPRLKVILLSLATLCAPVALAQTANPAVPGTINYVEGSASINGGPLNQQSVGYAQLQPGQVLQTANGRAELLLTPGVFLRVGENSAVRMISPNLLNTQIALDHGRADYPPIRPAFSMWPSLDRHQRSTPERSRCVPVVTKRPPSNVSQYTSRLRLSASPVSLR